MNEVHRQLEAFRGSRDKKKYVAYFTASNERFEALLQCICRLDPYPFKEYSSWLLVHIIRGKKKHGGPLYKDLVDTLFKTKDPTVLRNISCCIKEIGVQEYRESEFIDLLIGFVSDASHKVALQMFSIRILMQFCEIYPELTSEIREVIHLNKEGKTAAYKVAIRDFEKRFPV